MTFAKTLKRETAGGYEITATENYDKFCSVPYYRIEVGKVGDPIVLWTYNTAATTWRRKFKQVVEEFK